MNDKWLLTRHNKEFISWFNKRNSNDDGASEILKRLSYIQKFIVITWKTYNIFNHSFYIKAKDDGSIMQNNGVMVEVKSMYFSSLKDKNPILATTVFYGVIEEINYVIFKVPLFKFKWIPKNNIVQTDELGFIRVDLGKETSNTKPFIMSTQANQVFYVKDPANLSKRWSIILKRKHIPHSDDESFYISFIPSYATQLHTSYEEVDRNDVHVIRNDHQEGMWKN